MPRKFGRVLLSAPPIQPSLVYTRWCLHWSCLILQPTTSEIHAWYLRCLPALLTWVRTTWSCLKCTWFWIGFLSWPFQTQYHFSVCLMLANTAVILLVWSNSRLLWLLTTFFLSRWTTSFNAPWRSLSAGHLSVAHSFLLHAFFRFDLIAPACIKLSRILFAFSNELIWPSSFTAVLLLLNTWFQDFRCHFSSI